MTTRPDRWKDREGFFKELREVLKAAPHVHFILAAREEHLAALERYDDLLSGASRSRYHLERLTVGQAKEAILKPARGRIYARREAREQSGVRAAEV